MTADEEVRQEAVRLVNSMIAASEAEMWEGADQFVAMTTGAGGDGIFFNGPFPDAPTALAWAEQHEAELNHGNTGDDDVFIVSVYPVMTPS